MKLAIFAHCAMDTITIGENTYERPGGPACYCSITARKFKFDVELHTRFGADFPIQYLGEYGIDAPGGLSPNPTTRFAIDIAGPDRTMTLKNVCDTIEYSGTAADGALISPIYNEIPQETLSGVKSDSGFVMVDPQGFLRGTNPQNRITMKKCGIDLSGIDAVKVSQPEGMALTGSTGDMMAKSLQKLGIKHVLVTDKTTVSMLSGDKMYAITLPNKDIHDTTGIGDIFCAAFCCTMLKERDILWALCFAGGAAQAALGSRQMGLSKIPGRSEIQTNASYFYNLVKFRTV